MPQKSNPQTKYKPNLSLLAGIVLMLISTIFFATMNAIIKSLNTMGYSSMENVFFRAFFMIVSLYVVIGVFPLLHRHFPKSFPADKCPQIKAKQKGGFNSMLMRGIFGGVAVSIAYYNFATIPLGIATAFLQSTPIFVVLLSFFTRTKPSIFILFATIIGFIGVLLVANPQHSEIPLINALIGIIGAISAALAFLTIPSLKKFYTSEAVVLWYGVAMCLVGIVGMIVGDFVGIEQMGGFIFPSVFAWTLFILCGITGAIGQWLMTKSYMYAPPDIVAPIAYMRIVWSLIFGVLLGDSLPNIIPSIGIALILLSGVLVSFYALRENFAKI